MYKGPFINASIMHPTDFSPWSMKAFAHALKISLAIKCRLYVAHIAASRGDHDWTGFPHVRETLARWGLLPANASPHDIFDRLGVQIAKVEIESQDSVAGLSRFLSDHPSDLLILATQRRDGLPAWLHHSVAAAMSRRTHTSTLFVPSNAAGFVDEATGAQRLETVLFPVDRHPPAAPAVVAVSRFCRDFGVNPKVHFVHFGGDASALGVDGVTLRDGNAVDGILQAAADRKADLIAMATAGRHGVLDALRGSTTERVLHHAPCPVLAIPYFGEAGA
jgi:nucleotide-binding universal stress UspA family protein